MSAEVDGVTERDAVPVETEDRSCLLGCTRGGDFVATERDAVPVETEDRSCPVGCPRGDDFVVRGGDRLHGKPGCFNVVRCRTCGLLRTNPRPTQGTIGFFYPSNYRAFRTPPRIIVRKRRPFFDAWRGVKRKVLDTYGEALPISPPGFLYEVGCGNGHFLQRMSAEGWSVAGVEMSPHGVRNARALGLEVEQSPLEGAEGPGFVADLVVAWNVLEHLHEPIAALRRLAAFTAPGAWLAGSVPNVASLDFRLFGDAWYALQLPAHLFHFSEDTLRVVLARGGFRLERVLHQRNLANYWKSAVYVTEDRQGLAAQVGRSISMFAANLPPLARHLGFPLAMVASALGQTGRMTFWARR